MKIKELIEMLERAAEKVDGDLSEVEVSFHVGHWTTQMIAPLKIEDVGFSYGPEGDSVYIDVLLQEKDFKYAEKGIEDYKKYWVEDDEE